MDVQTPPKNNTYIDTPKKAEQTPPQVPQHKKQSHSPRSDRKSAGRSSGRRTAGRSPIPQRFVLFI